MTITINIFRRPSLAVSGETSLLARYVALNYRHRITAMGWYETAACEVLPPAMQYSTLIDDYIGARVMIYGSDPSRPIWTGTINRVSYVRNGVAFNNSIDSMYNSVASRANNVITAIVTNAESIAKYGRKHATIDVGSHTGVVGLSETRDTLLGMNAWPQKSKVRAAGQSNTPLRLEMVGDSQTLGWSVATNSSTTAIAFSAAVRAIIAMSNTQGNVWYNNTASDYVDVVDNLTPTIAPNSYYTLTNLEAMRKVVEGGDNLGRRWVFGIKYEVNTRTRRLYYRQADFTIKYTARISDGLRIRDLSNRLVDPASVTPDCGFMITDIFPTWNGTGDNPAETYIEAVEYDDNSKEVTMIGADDPRIEGLFQTRRYGKIRGGRYGVQAY